MSKADEHSEAETVGWTAIAGLDTVEGTKAVMNGAFEKS